ncbi:LysR family transcriptional regulator [Pyxidicoccus fallax]|uniref:LysR family transcriptional regulator n=1 Tax=Pyxidicoccus fallax TaxID=394095 RepID=A0A848LVB1_9BACT|nr:LysR family transcriptional regulator [Pyxidicoccus fallax]NMO21550.1 LysR family transcriptional regulator [Pyxidicoccus fallax]NPC84846.1 LysR family transcriptional regulator [Pyxidicoccus fallax]
MESLSAIGVFVRVAEASSFALAARTLGITPSAASKSVARLEERLGTRLFQRTTRRMHLTEPGTRFYERCVRILEELREAETDLSREQRAPRGRLRVSVPEFVALRFLIPALPRFRKEFPKLELQLDLDDHVRDIVGDGLDAAVRCGELTDSRLMRRRFRPKRFILCASPEYLQARGLPRTVEDLAGHDCIRYRFTSTGRIEEWSLRQEPGAPAPRIPETFSFNNGEAVLQAAKVGLGVAQVLELMALPELAAGTLQPVLPGLTVERGALWLVWPPARPTPPKVKVFGDFLARLFAQVS